MTVETLATIAEKLNLNKREFKKKNLKISLKRKLLTKKTGGFVVLPLKEYERLREQAIPIFQLHGKQAKQIDKLVETGLKEYREGKCKKLKSLSDLD